MNGLPIVYLDETGFEHSAHRLFAWMARGSRVFGYVDGQRRPRTSLVGGYLNHRLIAPLLFEGTCNTEVFNAWLKQQLLPSLPTGSLLVLDNAAFHKAASTQAMVQSAGHRLLFLPPYSPHLNPIEKCWANLKRQRQYHAHLTLDQLINTSNYL